MSKNDSFFPNISFDYYLDNSILEKILFRIELWRVAHGYILFPLCVLGIVGNILSVVILNRKAVRSSSIAVYLRCLAVADLLVLITAIFRYRCYKLFLDDTGEIWTVYHFDPYIQVYVEPLHWIALGSSSFITLTLSIERYLAVRYPVEIKHSCTTTLVWAVVGFIAIVTSVITIPNFFAYTVEPFQTDDNSSVFVAKLTDMGQRTLYHCTYHNYVLTFIWYLVPWVLLAIFSVLLSKHVRRSNKIRTGANINPKPNRNLTILIISIVVVYMACNFPNCIIVFYNLVHHMKENDVCTHETQGLLSKTSKTYDVIEVIGELLNVLNSCINIILYCLVGTKFREELKKFIVCQRCRNNRNRIKPVDSTRSNTTRSPNVSNENDSRRI